MLCFSLFLKIVGEEDAKRRAWKAIRLSNGESLKRIKDRCMKELISRELQV